MSEPLNGRSIDMTEEKANDIDIQIKRLRLEKQELQWQDYVENWRPHYKALVGKCYKYRNSYGEDTGKWWLYKRMARWLEGDHVDFIVTEKFQTTSGGNSDWSNDVVILGGSFQIDPLDGYIEISEDEYQEAKANFMSEMATQKNYVKEILKP